MTADTPHPDPADEALITNPSETSNSLGVSSLPQTLGEEIPVVMRDGLELLRESQGRAPFSAIDPQGWALWLADARSRLVEALEQEKAVVAMLVENMNTYVSQRDSFAARCTELQSASVLQKEELKQLVTKHGNAVLGRYYSASREWNGAREALQAIMDAVIAIPSPTSGA